MDAMHRLLIGVIGAGNASDEGYEQAREVGAGLARHGAALLCGGLGGVMEAASRGCRESGGTVIGMLPGSEAASGNPYLSFSLPTDLGYARNVLIALASRALIAVEGEYGTLSEIAVGLKLGRPVITLNCAWQIPGTLVASSPEEAVALAFQSLGRNE